MTLSRTRIKICGVRDPAMALAAARAGADAVGLVFHGASPRAVDVAQAVRIAAVLPPFVTSVGLFVDAPDARVAEVLASVPLGLLQFHGDESPGYCASFGRPWLKAIRVGEGTDLVECSLRFSGAAALLLDAFVPGEHGGTGRSFDWSRIPPELRRRVVLSGGLDPANVGSAIAQVRPWAVDVSSGVESARGVKDAARIEAFVRSVKDADARLGG